MSLELYGSAIDFIRFTGATFDSLLSIRLIGLVKTSFASVNLTFGTYSSYEFDEEESKSDFVSSAILVTLI